MIMRERNEAHIKAIALVAALGIHGILLMVPLPSRTPSTRALQDSPTLVVSRYIPPPPPPAQARSMRYQKIVRRVPIPDPTPGQPEPIREPRNVYVGTEVVSEFDLMIGTPEAPPAPAGSGAAGPLVVGVADVDPPVLIEESKVPPVYPRLARLNRITGNVVLQAVIREDGTVAELAVLTSTQRHFGFEDAAVDAVRQWRYHPATQNGRPVSVYFTVVVTFMLT